MELHVSKEAVNLESGNFVNMAEGKKAAKKRTNGKITKEQIVNVSNSH